MCPVRTRFSKVSRRKGGTLSSRYLNNGYVLRETAIAGKPAPTFARCTSGKTQLHGRPSSRASPLPHLDPVHPVKLGCLLGRYREQVESSHRPSHIRAVYTRCPSAQALRGQQRRIRQLPNQAIALNHFPIKQRLQLVQVLIRTFVQSLLLQERNLVASHVLDR